jgi:adenine-specific DNA-methyltransferase
LSCFSDGGNCWQKPEALLNRIILVSSNVGDVVLDPFSGTFTTAAVAKKLGRKSISIEFQSDYLKIGLRRVLEIQEYLGETLTPLKKNTAVKNGRGVNYENTTGDMFNVSVEA